MAPVVVGDDLSTVKMGGYDNEADSHKTCQQALGVRANVVVKVLAYQEALTDASYAGTYGQQLAVALLQRVNV